MSYSHNGNAQIAVHRPARGPIDLLSDALTIAWTWRHRARSRRSLSALDDHQLRDIGLSPLDRDREVVKPFWVR